MTWMSSSCISKPTSWQPCYKLRMQAFYDHSLSSCVNISFSIIICISTGRGHSLILGKQTNLVWTTTLYSPPSLFDSGLTWVEIPGQQRTELFLDPSFLPCKSLRGIDFLKDSFSEVSEVRITCKSFQDYRNLMIKLCNSTPANCFYFFLHLL